MKAAIPFERVSTTTYPNRRGIPRLMMEENMARRKTVLELSHPNAAGIDIGSASHFVAVPPDRDDEAVREFKSFTDDLNALADWLLASALIRLRWNRRGFTGYRCSSCWKRGD